MKKLVVLCFVTAITLSCFTPMATAQEKSGDNADMKAVLAELKKLRTEIKALRGEIAQLKAQLKKQQPQQKNKRQPDNKVYNIDTKGAPFQGPENAKVTVVSYFDLQCPYCIREVPVIKQVMAKYPKDVKVVFKNFPLSFHKQAKPVHAVCMEAFNQGGNEKFWGMYDKIVANSKQIFIREGKENRLNEEKLKSFATELGLDVAKISDVLSDPAKQNALLKSDMTKAKTYGVRGTPSVFINGKKLSPRGFDNYCARIDEILSGKDKQKAPAKPARKVNAKGDSIKVKKLPAPPANLQKEKKQ